MNITAVGIDLAKNVLQVHAVDARGKAVLRRQLRREQVTAFFAKLPACLIGMEGCASAHHWGRTLERFGHTVRLMAPQFVKPYVKTNKNDVADAEAICEAVTRPNMRFVPIKSIEQQAVLSFHRVRQGFVKARTAQANQIRGLLGEFGLVIPKGIWHVAQRVPGLLEDASNELPLALRQLIDRLTDHLKGLDRQVRELEREISRGIGTAASAASSSRFQVSDHSPLRHWLPRLPMPEASTMAGRYRLGSGWYRGRTRAAGNPRYSGSANGAMYTCARC